MSKQKKISHRRIKTETPPCSQEEREMFLNAFHQNKDFKPPKEAKPSSPSSSPPMVSSQELELFLDAIESHCFINKDSSSPPPLSTNPKVSKKKLRGEPQRSLDLHGLTSFEARMEVKSFIAESKKQGCQKILIIHGKGQGILKSTVYEILEDHPLVENYMPGIGKYGGSGAVIIKICKKSRYKS